jgi:hypothetical protein
VKTYIVYVNGVESGTIQATSHNQAEQKAQKAFDMRWKANLKIHPYLPKPQVSVAYTEI